MNASDSTRIRRTMARARTRGGFITIQLRSWSLVLGPWFLVLGPSFWSMVRPWSMVRQSAVDQEPRTKNGPRTKNQELRTNLLGRRRPGRALILFRHRTDALERELLDALSFVGFGRIDVALRIGRDVVHA